MSRTRVERISADGVELRVELDGAGPPLLVLHGFSGSARSMAEVSAALRDSYQTIRVDLLGHGSSAAPRDPKLYSMPACARQIVAVLDALSLSGVHVLGYSMGGRVGLSLCLWHPTRIRSALLIGASAGLEDEPARAARRRDDEALAQRIERDGIEAFVEHWMALPLFASQKRLGHERLASARAQRLENRSHGLALSLRGMGSGAQPALHAQLGAVQTPVCLVVGSEDAKFRSIAADLAARLPRARVELIAEAGHAAHLENLSALSQSALRFLAEAEAEISSRETPPERSSAQAMKGSTAWSA